MAKCSILKGDLDRLGCFDGVTKSFRLNGLQSQPVKVAGTGRWQVHQDKNPIDDTERVIATLPSDNERSKWEQPIGLIVRCQSKKTELYINWSNFLGNDSSNVYDDWKYVTIRIGTDKAQKQKWGISTDKQATFAPNWAGDLLREMVKVDTFLAQVTPYGESPVTAIFDIRGMSSAIEPLAKACGWDMNNKKLAGD